VHCVLLVAPSIRGEAGSLYFSTHCRKFILVQISDSLFQYGFQRAVFHDLLINTL
jgi:hypothetical protein